MTTVIIDERTKKGKIILDLVREMKAGQILVENRKKNPVFNRATLDAIIEASKGQTIVCENYDDYLKKVGK
jgi:hypothetical protein